MGSVKEHWLETRATHQLTFVCPKCEFSCAAFLRPPEPYEIKEEGDYHVEVVECFRCQSKWTVELFAEKEFDEYEGVLRECNNTVVSLSELDLSAELDDWYNYYDPEPRAFEIFQTALRDWWQLLPKIAALGECTNSINRMLLVHLFSTVEAYLFNEIVGIAERDPAVQRGIIKALPVLKNQSVKLSSVAENPALVSDEVKKALQAVSFHNFSVVESLCRDGLQQSILPESHDERNLIMTAVNCRHDCVHRNGFKKDGSPIDDVTLDWLMSLAKAFERLARRLQTKIHDIDGYRMARVHFSNIEVPEQ